MKYYVDRGAADSAYVQIYKQLREDIVTGLIPPGRRLPSKRTLSGELGVSLITVEHALALLVDEGYAVARERSGCYACFGRQASAPRRPLPPVSPAPAVSAPADFPFSLLERTMRRVLSDYGRRILERVPGEGSLRLREAVAGYLGRTRALAVAPERIVIGAGAEYLYSLIVQLLGRDCVIALEEPGYGRIRKVYEANGARCMPLEMGEDGILPSELGRCRAGALHVTPFNSYPSGVTASASKRHEYARWAEERGGYIIEDDYDSEFSSGPRQIETICSLSPDRVIYINTFSKTLAPAMRTAYMVLPEPLLEEYRRRLGFYSCTVPAYEQYVLAELISGGELERIINRRRRQMRKAAIS